MLRNIGLTDSLTCAVPSRDWFVSSCHNSSIFEVLLGLRHGKLHPRHQVAIRTSFLRVQIHKHVPWKLQIFNSCKRIKSIDKNLQILNIDFSKFQFGFDTKKGFPITSTPFHPRTFICP